MTFSTFIEEKHVEFENKIQKIEQVTYKMPPIIVNDGAQIVGNGQSIGFIEITNSLDARKINTLLWSFIVGTILYALMRLSVRKSMIQLLKPFTKKVNPIIMDKMS